MIAKDLLSMMKHYDFVFRFDHEFYGRFEEEGELVRELKNFKIEMNLLIRQVMMWKIPLVIQWDAGRNKVKYSFCGFYAPLELFEDQVTGQLESKLGDSIHYIEEIGTLAYCIFEKIHQGRDRPIASTSPWMPFILLTVPNMIKKGDKPNTYIC